MACALCVFAPVMFVGFFPSGLPSGLFFLPAHADLSALPSLHSISVSALSSDRSMRNGGELGPQSHG